MMNPRRSWPPPERSFHRPAPNTFPNTVRPVHPPATPDGHRAPNGAPSARGGSRNSVPPFPNSTIFKEYPLYSSRESTRTSQPTYDMNNNRISNSNQYSKLPVATTGTTRQVYPEPGPSRGSHHCGPNTRSYASQNRPNNVPLHRNQNRNSYDNSRPSLDNNRFGFRNQAPSSSGPCQQQSGRNQNYGPSGSRPSNATNQSGLPATGSNSNNRNNVCQFGGGARNSAKSNCEPSVPSKVVGPPQILQRPKLHRAHLAAKVRVSLFLNRDNLNRTFAQGNYAPSSSDLPVPPFLGASRVIKIKALKLPSPKYLCPKQLQELKDNTVDTVLRMFRKRLLCSTARSTSILRRLTPDELNHLYTIILIYFNHLQTRLQAKQVSYLDLIDFKVYMHDDFCSYGSRFIEFLERSGLFKSREVNLYASLYKSYTQLHPPQVLTLRSIALEMRAELGEQLTQMASDKKHDQSRVEELTQDLGSGSDSDQSSEDGDDEDETEYVPEFKKIKKRSDSVDVKINYQMITHKMVDSRHLYASVSVLEDSDKQIEHFLRVIHLSDKQKRQLNRFIQLLNKVLQSTKLACLKPRILQFGSLVSGLGTYDSDLDLVIQFETIPDDVVIDYSTAMLTLEVVVQIMQIKLDLKNNERLIVPSRRCPIVRMDFFWCFPQIKEQVYGMSKTLEFTKCDISINRFYGVYNSGLLHFLVQLEPRFHSVVLLLKYWAKRHNLIDVGYFSSYGFTLMVLFYLQTTEPPVLPSVERLQSLAKQQQSNKPELRIEEYCFNICDNVELVGKSLNNQTVQELIVGFFRFYYNFNFNKHCISPRLGKLTLKESLYQQKASSLPKRVDRRFKASYICIEDPFVLDHNVGSCFREANKWQWLDLLEETLSDLNINTNNCVEVLTDPENFNDGIICE